MCDLVAEAGTPFEIVVDSLDLAALGFKYAAGAPGAGQPAYAPADLLKLYLYGYLSRVRSSCRLEPECLRNLERKLVGGRKLGIPQAMTHAGNDLGQLVLMIEQAEALIGADAEHDC
jgi:hypothetical protein